MEPQSLATEKKSPPATATATANGTQPIDSFKVAADVAEAEFDRFCLVFELDVDPAQMDEKDKASFRQHKAVVTNAIRRGRLTFDGESRPVFRTSEGVELVFNEPRGKNIKAMDKQREGHNVSSEIAILAEITEKPPVTFENMLNRDWKVCNAFFTLFMAG